MKTLGPATAPGGGVSPPTVPSAPAKDPVHRKGENKKGESESDLRHRAISVLTSCGRHIDESTIEIVIDRLRARKEEGERRKKGGVRRNFTEADVEREEREEKARLKRAGLKDEVGSVAGIPDIAHPDDDEKWELQTAFFTSFLFEIWERAEARDKKAAREARAELQTFFLNSLSQSLRLALDDKNSTASEWACKLLEDIFGSISKHVGKVRIEKPYGKLMETEAFKDEKKRIGKVRRDMLSPGMVCAITQRELKKAGRYRKRLLRLSSIEAARAAWRAAAKRQNIPELYWPTVKLPEFSEKHLPKWLEFLWPIIQTYLPKEDSWYERQPQHEPRKRYLYDFQKTAHDHLEALARLRDKRLFYLF
jgi:hypothetical protein